MSEQKSRGFVDLDEEPSKLCAWRKNAEAMSYVRYNGCCSLHCRDLMECDKELAEKDKRIRALEGVVECAKRLHENYEYFYLHETLAVYHQDSEMARDLKIMRDALEKLKEL